MHIDMNSYFASVEQQANPFLRGRPIGVTGKRQERSVVAAASREAKKLGVKTAMATWEAKRILPSIIIVMGDPEKYGEITQRFNNIFHEFTDRVQQFSVDESFLDVSDIARTYEDAQQIALEIKKRLREDCGECITASIGIAPNKLVAKAASEFKKPDGLTVVRPREVLPFLDRLNLQDICGIGPRIEKRLNAMGIENLTQLRERPVEDLTNEFKSYGAWLHEAAFGHDASEVVPGEEEPKSMGHSYTFPRDLRTAEEIRRGLLMLCDRVAWRLRREGFAAREVTAYVRYGNFGSDGRQHRFQEPVNDGLKIFEIAWNIVSQLPGVDYGKSVRLLGVTAGALTRGAQQASLFEKERKMTSTLSALDSLQRRFGSSAWTRAALLKTKLLERTSGFHYDHEI